MKIGAGRLRLSKLPEAPPNPTSNDNNDNKVGQSPDLSSTTTTSKSSPHLVYSDTHPTTHPTTNSTPIINSSSNSSDNLHIHNNSHGSSGGGGGIAKIISSQSKSSGALLTPHKWGGGDLSSGTGNSNINDIYKLLAEQKLTDEDIWEGNPNLFPILNQFQDLFQKNASSSTSVGGGNVLSVILPEDSAFLGVKKRTYKIGKKLTVSQAINLICKKQNVKEPRRFWLSTIVGCVLNDDLLLSTYGFGTFFDSWELKLIFKSTFTDRIITDFSSLSIGQDFIIDFQLPPLKQFNGLKKKRIKVSSLWSINNIIESIWKKYRITDEPFERFSIITNEEFPLVLHPNATLSHYGAGNGSFQNIELNIIYSEFIPPYSLISGFIPSYGCYQVGNINSTKSKAVIVDLENKLHESMNLNEEMVQNIKNLAQTIKDREQEMKDKESLHLSAMNMIEERVVTLKKDVAIEKENYQNQISQLEQDKCNLSSQITSLKSDVEDMNSKLFQEKTANTEKSMELNYQISSLKEQNQSLQDSLTESLSTHKDTQDRLDQLKQQKDEDDSKYIDQIGKLKFQYHDLVEKHKQEEREQEEISNRIYTDTLSKIDGDNNNNNTSSNSEIDNIENEQLLMSFKKLQQDLSDRDVLIKSVYPKKIQSLEANGKRLESKIQDLEKDNQKSSQTIAVQLLEIQELKRQLDSLKVSHKDLQSQSDLTATQLKEEEKKNRKLLYDQATLNNELEHERLQREDLNKTIVDLEATKMAVEISAKQRESILLLEIEELKKPKPPPLPTYEIKNLRSPDTNDVNSEILDAKNSLKKPPPQIKFEPKEHAIHTVADILFVSMQKRFKSIQDDDEIEALDDDFNDDFED